MKSNLHQLYQPLFKYIPENAQEELILLFQKYPVRLKVSKPRKTLLGTYRKNKKGQDEISINGDLNSFAFLITLLHEYAHLIAFQRHGFRISPHGKQWQKTFAEVLHPFLNNGSFPENITTYLQSKGNNLTASQCTDFHLYGLLKAYDEKEDDDAVLLKTLNIGDQFILSNGLRFEKVKINRTRAVCKKVEGINHSALYTISLLAEVTPIE